MAPSDKESGAERAMEDELLAHLVNIYGEKKWSCIAGDAEIPNWEAVQGEMVQPYEAGHQKEPWSVEEDIVQIRAHFDLGSRWSKNSKRLPARTENSIKNRRNINKRKCGRR